MTFDQIPAFGRRGGAMAGILLMLVSVLLFSLNDALGKWLVATYSVTQIMLVRGIASLVVLAPFLLRGGMEPLRTAPQPMLQLVRVVLSTAEVGFFYFALGYLPLADAMTYYLAAPIYVTAMSALFLKERVGPYRWSAVLVGFAGVLVALRPSSEALSLGSLVAIGGSMFFALFLIVTRKLRGTSNAVLVGWQFAASTVVGAVGSLWGWTPVAGSDFMLLLVLGVVAVSAFALMNVSLKLAPASVVVPFQYTLIVWAVIFGYLFFGDVPQLNVILGAAVIIASGLFIFLREQRLAKRAA
jgi:drug/metabolite transporter (DMT)-like permease